MNPAERDRKIRQATTKVADLQHQLDNVYQILICLTHNRPHLEAMVREMAEKRAAYNIEIEVSPGSS